MGELIKWGQSLNGLVITLSQCTEIGWYVRDLLMLVVAVSGGTESSGLIVIIAFAEGFWVIR